MRNLSFDQYEFERPDSEESLELWIAARSDFPFPDMLSFVSGVATVQIAETLGPGVPFDTIFYSIMVRDYLLRFAGIDVPQPCDWRSYELHNDGCDWDAVFEAKEMFIRFHWWSTA